MIKLIYFDFGGVLVNIGDVLKTVCKDFKLNSEEFKKFYADFDHDLAFGKISNDYFWKRCVEKFCLKNAESYDFPKSWVSDYKIIKPINELIYSLEGKIEIGILSNVNPGVWEAALKDNWVPNIKYKNTFLSYKLGMVKPNPKIYELAQSQSQVKPEEILFVDDRAENLITPKEMGWKTVLFDQKMAKECVKKIKQVI